MPGAWALRQCGEQVKRSWRESPMPVIGGGLVPPYRLAVGQAHRPRTPSDCIGIGLGVALPHDPRSRDRVEPNREVYAIVVDRGAY